MSLNRVIVSFCPRSRYVLGVRIADIATVPWPSAVIFRHKRWTSNSSMVGPRENSTPITTLAASAAQSLAIATGTLNTSAMSNTPPQATAESSPRLYPYASFASRYRTP